ncbi:unnamed protein product [Pleuronectes platessa]|uniref:Uncharacterized protein n=1 Tax=Pleuronectes platessa TaxID=8262 RepID=A0A9N7U3V7_PLEPL|nr:unnamed protein product [Pleuronectes platessa]
MLFDRNFNYDRIATTELSIRHSGPEPIPAYVGFNLLGDIEDEACLKNEGAEQVRSDNIWLNFGGMPIMCHAQGWTEGWNSLTTADRPSRTGTVCDEATQGIKCGELEATVFEIQRDADETSHQSEVNVGLRITEVKT